MPPLYALNEFNVGNPALSSHQKKMAGKVLNLYNENRFIANGTFTVPTYVDRIKVGVCAQGGDCQYIDGAGLDNTYFPGLDSPWAVAYVDCDPGQTFNVVFNADSTVFGSILASYKPGLSGGFSTYTPPSGQEYVGLCHRADVADTIEGGTGFWYVQRFGQGARPVGGTYVGLSFADGHIQKIPAGRAACIVQW